MNRYGLQHLTPHFLGKTTLKGSRHTPLSIHLHWPILTFQKLQWSLLGSTVEYSKISLYLMKHHLSKETTLNIMAEEC